MKATRTITITIGAMALTGLAAACGTATPAATAPASSISAGAAPSACATTTPGCNGYQSPAPLTRAQIKAQKVQAARLLRRVERQQLAASKALAAKKARQHHAWLIANSVQYIVTGSSADVTYGPEGSDFQGSVPMDVTARIGDPEYYAIDAQLNGGGAVRCEIKVAGQVVARASATGGYNIAMCEIVSDGMGGWTSA